MQRWGKDGLHRFDVFSPELYEHDLTPQKLYQLGREELSRRIHSIVSYEVSAADLYSVANWTHEVVHSGDIVRIKDQFFDPPLYLEATVVRTERSYTDPGRNTYMLGEYKEVDPDTYKPSVIFKK